MGRSLQEIAQMLGAQVIGDPSVEIRDARPLYEAHEGDLTFFDAALAVPQAAACPASAFLVPPGIPFNDPRPRIEVRDVHAAFTQIVAEFRPSWTEPACGVSPDAQVDPSAKIAPGANIHAGATIGAHVEIGPGTTIHVGVRIMAGCKIGQDVEIFPNAVLYPGTIIGPRVIIHGGAVLGAYGFGYRPVQGRHQRSAQLGNVEIGADCEVGALTTIDRGTFGATSVGEGTKIDNLVQIGHNCRIGKHNLLCSQTGIAGSTTTGDYVVMGGQCGVRDHVHVGKGAQLGAMSGVMRDVPEGTRWVGVPAMPERETFTLHACLAKLPEMRKQLREVIKLIESKTGQALPERKSA
jgi:UDP-3-O-[3-hydroxymyristoyl] glucosamine N-acyltransferase